MLFHSLENAVILKRFHDKVKSTMDSYVQHKFTDGEVLRWTRGKYKGRLCVVRRSSWEFDSSMPDGVEIHLLVKTYRSDGKGFVSHYDLFHRKYRSTHSFEKVV